MPITYVDKLDLNVQDFKNDNSYQSHGIRVRNWNWVNCPPGPIVYNAADRESIVIEQPGAANIVLPPGVEDARVQVLWRNGLTTNSVSAQSGETIEYLPAVVLDSCDWGWVQFHWDLANNTWRILV